MAEAVVSFAVERLGDLLSQEVNFLFGVKGQVEQLQRELKLMQSFLKDADKRQDEDARVGDWVSEIREAAYRAEGVIETFMLKVASRGSRRGIQNTIKRYACFMDKAVQLHKIGSEIEAINSSLSNLRTCLQTYGITSIRVDECGEGPSSAQKTQVRLNRPRVYSHVVEEYIVGFDKDIEILVEQLVNEDEEYNCGSIWGMGGLGKTTLAKQVYHHPDVRRHFDGVAWASISQDFKRITSQEKKRKEFFEGILFELISPSKDEREEIKNMKEVEVVQKLHQAQVKQKCLVILDDIWTTQDWDELSPAFPVGKGGSKLLLTTRNKVVADHADVGRGFIHQPKLLSIDDSWKLLKKAAFRGKTDLDSRTKADMENLGRKMVERCAGLPLAIVVLGGVLATKRTFGEWDSIHKRINTVLRRGKGNDQQYSAGVSAVLALSYDDLSYQLKQCFLYFCYFLEDAEISTKKTERFWVAEGIISSMQSCLEGEESLEDIAEHCLGELIDRSMIQAVKMGSAGRVKTCSLHDLMRDLCLSKADQENFMEVVRLPDENRKMGCRQVHRVAIDMFDESFENCYERERTKYLRSLLVWNCQTSPRNRKVVQSWIVNLKLLRVLDLAGSYSGISGLGKEVASVIGNLIHLRYLGLQIKNDTRIPLSFGNLRCLQTLMIEGDGNIGIPNVIWKMEQLRHLCLPQEFGIIGKNFKGNSDKLQLGNLRDLQTLKGIDTRRCEVKELIRLTNLKKLGISGYSESLKELEGTDGHALNNLQSLDIRIISRPDAEEETISLRIISSCHHLYKLRTEGAIENLPEYHHFPQYLTKLSLEDSCLQEDPMTTLENLHYLRILKLLQRSFLGKKLVCSSSNGFPQLKILKLKSLEELEEWCVGEGAMPNLSNLTIHSCHRLKMIPEKFITDLLKLDIRGMPPEFENRLQIGDRFPS